MPSGLGAKKNDERGLQSSTPFKGGKCRECLLFRDGIVLQIRGIFGLRGRRSRYLCWQQSCKMQYRRTGCRLVGNGIRGEMNGTVMKCNVAETKWKR